MNGDRAIGEDSPDYSGDSTMRRISRVIACLALCCGFASSAWAAQPALVSADWSVNGAHNLASNPPSLDAVEDFTGRAIGESEDNPPVDVCEFRFADLRSSGNLSLIVSVAPGSWGCTELYVFDRTPKGFEVYETEAVVGHDLAKSVLDINHDGRHELVLWGDLAPFARNGFPCGAQWPLIFAWTGGGYSEVGDQYKDYYRNYLKSLETRLAAYSPESGPASAQTAIPAPAVAVPGFGNNSGEGIVGVRPPAPTPKAAPTPDEQARQQAQLDYPCTTIEAAKTEAFLGIDSASTMSAAIKDSESADPNKRILAAVIFSFLGSQEAKDDLKTLSNDADSRVADIAKKTASMGEDPGPSGSTIARQVNPPGIPAASFMR